MHTDKPAQASVLVVEDDEFTARLLQFLLEREQYDVILVGDGQAALTHMATHAPASIVLMDVMLPYVNGFEVLRQLRDHPVWGRTRVIMLSAKSEGSDIARALDAGADDYLIKPFKPEELFARIRRYRPTVRQNP